MNTAPLNIGDTLGWDSPDGTTSITLQRVTADVWSVTTYRGTLRVDDQCGSYDSEAEARAVARGYAVLAKAEAMAAPLRELAELGVRRQVPPTMAGAHLAKVSDPQHRALATAAVCGAVRRGGRDGEESVRTLMALARKGLLELHYEPGRGRRRVVEYGTLTPAGARELARLDRAQAEADRLAGLR
jgi:hypothetical protein